MTYTVVVSERATRYLERADRTTQLRVRAMLNLLAQDPYDIRHSKALRGPGDFRSARVGNLRLIFVVERGELLVLVERIAPRGQVYRNL
mgnify:CR=1 FL=1